MSLIIVKFLSAGRICAGEGKEGKRDRDERETVVMRRGGKSSQRERTQENWHSDKDQHASVKHVQYRIADL